MTEELQRIWKEPVMMQLR